MDGALGSQDKVWCTTTEMLYTYQSPCLIIVLDDHGTTVAALILLHQLLRNLVAVLNIVAASSPLELVVLSDGESLIGKVVVCRGVLVSGIRWNDVVGKDLLWRRSYLATSTLLKMTHAACTRDRKGYPGWCDGIDERRLSIVWKRTSSWVERVKLHNCLVIAVDGAVFVVRSSNTRGSYNSHAKFVKCDRNNKLSWRAFKLTITKNFLDRILWRRTIPSPVSKLPLTLFDGHVHAVKDGGNQLRLGFAKVLFCVEEWLRFLTHDIWVLL